jgi:EAL domain-containing protein (putative c-di-GMP-specific phosphodiesterase class I)
MSGNIFAYEALLRWNRPDGMMMPSQFIGMAEETGLINEIGFWVMSASCCWLKEMSAHIEPHKFRMSMNISARQLANDALPEMLEKICVEAGVPTSCFILEVTERTAMENPDHSSLVLSDLKQRGFILALDDFGTGHSSLSWLHRYPFDILKLDRSLTAEVGLTPNSNKMAAGILSLSKFLGLTVIAEGVERPSQKDELYFLGFRLMQGYHFGYPLPAWQTEAMREEKMLTA